MLQPFPKHTYMGIIYDLEALPTTHYMDMEPSGTGEPGWWLLLPAFCSLVYLG